MTPALALVILLLLILASVSLMKITHDLKTGPKYDFGDIGNTGPLEKESKKINKSDIKLGYNFSAEIDCKVLGTFYDEDDKYALTCPVIDQKIIPLPVITRIDDMANIKFGGKHTDIMLEKGRTIYQEYKANHKDEFLDLSK